MNHPCTIFWIPPGGVAACVKGMCMHIVECPGLHLPSTSPARGTMGIPIRQSIVPATLEMFSSAHRLQSHAKRYIAHISVNCPVRADVEDPTLVRLTAPHTGHSRDVGRAGGRHWGAARGKRARQSPSDIPESRESVEVTAPPRLGGSAGSALSPPDSSSSS